jgi:hypothetical protein
LKNTAKDIIYFKSIPADTVGARPFIYHPDTSIENRKAIIELSLKIIAIVPLLILILIILNSQRGFDCSVKRSKFCCAKYY